MKKLIFTLSFALLFGFACQLMAQATNNMASIGDPAQNPLADPVIKFPIPGPSIGDGGYGIYDNREGGWWAVPPTNKDAYGSFTAIKENALVFNIEKNETDGFSYGTFLYEKGSNEIVAGSEEFVGSVGAGETGAGGVSEIFTPRDMVGVWVKIGDETYYSINRFSLDPAGKKQQFTGTYLADPEDGYAYVWYTQSNTPSQSEPPNSVIRLALTGVSPSSTGAPLPGVLATMLLCGGVGGVGGYLRKRGAGDGSARE